MDLTKEGAEKIFLPVIKVVELCIRQVHMGSNRLRLVHAVSFLTGKLGKLAEDRSTTGLMGSLGLGARSSFQLEVRLCARGLAAYMAAQLTDTNELQLQPPPTPGPPRRFSKQGEQLIASVANTKRLKLYAPLADTADFVHQAITAPDTSMTGFLPFASQLIARLFPSAPHLEYLKHY